MSLFLEPFDIPCLKYYYQELKFFLSRPHSRLKGRAQNSLRMSIFAAIGPNRLVHFWCSKTYFLHYILPSFMIDSWESSSTDEMCVLWQVEMPCCCCCASRLLCILTSFRVLGGPESWSKYSSEVDFINCLHPICALRPTFAPVKSSSKVGRRGQIERKTVCIGPFWYHLVIRCIKSLHMKHETKCLQTQVVN